MNGTPTPWTDALLDRMRLQADPLADELMAEMVAERGPQAAYEVFGFLSEKLTASTARLPERMQAFLSDLSLPPWADPEQLRTAEHVFVDHGPHFLLFLYHKSLPTLYACAHGAQVLYRTGRLTPGTTGQPDFAPFTRRVGETGRFVLDVMLRDGLSHGGPGLLATRKVRLIHAAIRAFVQREGWDEATLGKPINQEDLAITLMTFSVSMMDALDTLRLAYSREEAEAWLHAWKVVGHEMGIVDELLPADLPQGRALLQAILDRQLAPSEAGQVLTRALLEFVAGNLPGTWLDASSQGLMQHLLRPAICEALDIQQKVGCWGKFVPKALTRLFRLEERLDKGTGLTSSAIHQLSYKLTHRFVEFYQKRYDDRFRRRIPSNWHQHES